MSIHDSDTIKQTPIGRRVESIPGSKIWRIQDTLAIGGSLWFYPAAVPIGNAAEGRIVCAMTPYLTFGLDCAGTANMTIFIQSERNITFPGTILFTVIPLFVGIHNAPPTPIFLPGWACSIRITNTSGALNWVSGHFKLASQGV